MTERLETARILRIGAERLRQLSVKEANPEAARQMLSIADDMDMNAAELEQSFAQQPPKPPEDAVA